MNILVEHTEEAQAPTQPPQDQQASSAATPQPRLDLSPIARRPAWVEIDLRRLQRNLELIFADKPRHVQLLSVVKDEGYGHGAYPVAKLALRTGATFLAFSTVEEAMCLRERDPRARILMLGDRPSAEFPWCVAHELTCCLSEPQSATALGLLAARAGKRVPVHIKINTGMNRYGVPWDKAAELAELITSIKSLHLEGVLSHFAQSDEADKTFANLQLDRFNRAFDSIVARRIRPPVRHLCNSGGFLDLPRAHFEMVRLGILPLGVYPSSVCRRIPGIEPVMSVKACIAAIQHLQPGDSVGYGMRFTAAAPRRIAVLPIGYG